MKTRLPKTNNKDLDKLLKKAEKEMWRIDKRGSGHIQCLSPDKETIVVVASSASSKQLHIVRGRFRKGGLNV